jgi:hypothetical protein
MATEISEAFEAWVARFVLVQTNQNGKNVPNDYKLYQTAKNHTKWPKNISNGHKILQHFPLQGPPNFTESGSLKRNHLATLFETLQIFETIFSYPLSYIHMYIH